MKKVFIKTFGCAQNERDSQLIEVGFKKAGYEIVSSLEQADEIVINTCSVRQSAEDRVYGLVNNIVKGGGKSKVVVTGCMVGLHGQYKLTKKMPRIDEFISIDKLLGRFDIEGMFPKVKGEAYVNIMSGCDNFCTYCVVPYARGRERSREIGDIIEEVTCLVDQGVEKIMLLGQNVNSWGKEFETEKIKRKIGKQKIAINKGGVGKYKTPFAMLLAVLDGIPGVKKISFLTSNPWDLTDDIIEAMGLPKVERFLHLPVQSGDDKVLARMNRKYTVGEYLALVKKIRKKIPGITLGTDIIVGFPGETKKQFENTVDLVNKVGFKVAYIAKYSPRPKTAAYKLDDDVSHVEKKRRWRVLDELINKKPALRQVGKDKKIIALFGPTGIGKTGLAVKLARKFDGEIVSVDSRQVYKRMDVVTGKDLKKGVKYKGLGVGGVGYYDFYKTRLWGVDLVKPSERFSAADFVKAVRVIIEDIIKRRKVPILTIGTYFYFKALVTEIETFGVKQDWKLREKLDRLSVGELQKKLKRLDGDRLLAMNKSDRNNPRRLIRAIEVAKNKESKPRGDAFDFEIIKVGLKLAKDELYRKIDKRVDERVKMGAFEEVEKLVKVGYGWDLSSMTGIGYKQLMAYFEGEETKGEVVKKWKLAEHKYSRAQMTWLAKDRQIKWFEVDKKGWEKKVMDCLLTLFQ